MKEHNFELIRGDDYTFLLKLKFSTNSSIDILSSKFQLQARKLEDESKSTKQHHTSFLPINRRCEGNKPVQSQNENKMKLRGEEELVLSLSTEQNSIKILKNGDVVLIFSHSDTDNASWKRAKYDLQMITNAHKYKTIMKGVITLIGDVTD